jgi:hypothetical protein
LQFAPPLLASSSSTAIQPGSKALPVWIGLQLIHEGAIGASIADEDARQLIWHMHLFPL